MSIDSENLPLVVSPWATLRHVAGHWVVAVRRRPPCEVVKSRLASDLMQEFHSPMTVAGVLERFQPEQHPEIRAMIKQFCRSDVLLPVVIDRGVARPQFVRNLRSVEVDLTWTCPQGCINCNRTLEMAPTADAMTVEQVKKFLREVETRGRTLDHIYLAGGEPTVHPQFAQIVHLVVAFRRSVSPTTEVILSTNGASYTLEEVWRLPRDVVVENSNKGTNCAFLDFHQIHAAPSDLPENAGRNYLAGCTQAAASSIGLSPNGYYPCSIMACIDRVFGFDVGRMQLPDESDLMLDQMERCCGLCGMKRVQHVAGAVAGGQVELSRSQLGMTPLEVETEGTVDKITASWERALESYRLKPPVLSKY